MKYLFLPVIFPLLFSCGGGSSSSSAAGVPLNEPVTDQTTQELLINGTDEGGTDGIETIWICSTSFATRGVGFVFMDSTSGQDIGLLYNISGGNAAHFWTVRDDGSVRMRDPSLGTIGLMDAPEFSGTGVFTSSNLSLYGVSEGATTCIRENFKTPISF